MNQPVHVTSIESVRKFKAELIRFEDEARTVLDTLQQHIYRVIEWIEHDRSAYWSAESRRAFDQVAQTRTRYQTCQLRTVAGHRPACIEEKLDYDRARRRLEKCQEMKQVIRDWGVKIRHEANEFRGRMSGFSQCVESDLPRMIAAIEQTAAALELYADAVPSDTDGS
jgi:hypothetical protein